LKLRIVSWNCQMALYDKFEQLLSLNPDIAIIPECASLAKDALKKRRLPCSAREWIGFNEDKGLGIFAFNGLQLRVHPSYSEQFQLYLPIEVSGPCDFHLLGCWMAEKKTMPGGTSNQPKDAVLFYRDFLTCKPAIVAGDFNYYIPTAELAGMGLKGAHGRRLRQTHYHKRKLDARPIAVDYVFVPTAGPLRLARFQVGKVQEWIQYSDHVPLIADFEIGPARSPRTWLVQLRENVRSHRQARGSASEPEESES
jgi:exodeoxyribonuclease III